MSTRTVAVSSCDLSTDHRLTVFHAKRLRLSEPKVCAKHGQITDDTYVVSVTDTSAAARRKVSPYAEQVRP